MTRLVVHKRDDQSACVSSTSFGLDGELGRHVCRHGTSHVVLLASSLNRAHSSRVLLLQSLLSNLLTV